MSGNKRGLTLIEVLVAIVLLGFAAAAYSAALAQSVTLSDVMHRQSVSIEGADQELAALTLFDAERLQLRALERRSPYSIDVSDAGTNLYAVSVRDERTGALLLNTVLYEPSGPTRP